MGFGGLYSHWKHFSKRKDTMLVLLLIVSIRYTGEGEYYQLNNTFRLIP